MTDRYKKDTSVDGHPIKDTLTSTYLNKDESIVVLNALSEALKLVIDMNMEETINV